MPSVNGGIIGDHVHAELITNPILQNALIDYIVNTPNNFNANLFRGFLENSVAQGKLVDNYMEKTSSDSSIIQIPIDPSDPSSKL